MNASLVPETAPDPDGRRRRAQDSRAKIVASLLDLVAAGEMQPSAEQVAASAKVGLRTVFRHFRDMESLYGEIVGMIEGQIMKVVIEPFQQTGGPDRMIELVGRRIRVYESIAPFKRAADVHRHRSGQLTAANVNMVQMSRMILRRELPPAIADDVERFELLDLLLSFESWDRLRREQGLSVEAARGLIEAEVRRLITV